MRAALRHPLGLMFLATSMALAVTMRYAPGLEPWSPKAPWILLWGLLAYAAVLIALLRFRQEASGPELRKLRAIRQTMEAKLSERRAAEGNDKRSELTRILSEAIVQLDKQVEPALRQLLERQQGLSIYLSRIEKGTLPGPGREVLERLQAIHARQQAAIEECVQQAANAAGTLVALLQEGDDANVAAQARTWAKDLLTLYDAIADVLRGGGSEEEIDGLIEDSSTVNPEVAQVLGLPPGELRDSDGSVNDLQRLVQDALRRLNEPGALSRCELIHRIPNTLAATTTLSGNGRAANTTPLKLSQALREVLTSAIDGLKPAGRAVHSDSRNALQHTILHEEYVRGMSTASIMVRHSISETTFHRNRREAIAAIARELTKQEELLSRDYASEHSGT